jgi:transcriptional regulator with XRE-family HTH domain
MKNLNSRAVRKKPHSSAIIALESEFPRRLKQAIGGRSVLSFAKACGMSDSLVRKYLSGSLPGLDKALIMAREAEVSLEWLATGVAPSHQGVGSGDGVSVDLDRMEKVIAETRRNFEARGIDLPPESEAKVIRMIYEFGVDGEFALDDEGLNRISMQGEMSDTPQSE